MKKSYIKPCQKIAILDCRECLLTGSDDPDQGIGGGSGDDVAGVKRRKLWGDDEW